MTLSNELTVRIIKHQQKIDGLINSLKDKLVVFDFDGTITEFKYGKNSILPCNGNDVNNYSLTHDMYDNARIPETIKYIINQLDKNNIYVLTKSVDNTKKLKNKKIEKEFDRFNVNHIIHTSYYEEKLKFLEMLYTDLKKEIVFFEDGADTLIAAEDKFPFVKGIHISSLLF